MPVVTQAARTYGGVSAEDRRIDRRARLIEAGFDVLGGDGLAKVTMTAVCGRAALTERYFYESFRNLSELQLAMFDELAAELAETIVSAIEAAPAALLPRCRAAANALISVLVADPRRARAFAEATGSEVLRERRDAAIRNFAAILADQMREFAGVTAARQQPHLRLVTTMLVGGLAEAVAAWLDGAIDVSQDELVDDAAQVAVAAARTLQRRAPISAAS
jgi:AcrR family transcriptional regulator